MGCGSLFYFMRQLMADDLLREGGKGFFFKLTLEGT